MLNPLLVKIVVVVGLLVVIGSLVKGLMALIGDRSGGERMVKALTVRIAVSVAIFVLLIVGVFTGLIVPHGIAP